MGKEERTPEKRTTRSATTLQSQPPNSPSTSGDLFSSPEQPIALDGLIAALPGRRPQIVEILRLLGPLSSPMLPMLIYGGRSTGKTTTILQIFRHLRRRFVYVSCRSCYCPRVLFDCVLDQLWRHRRSGKNRFSGANKCERASDFVNLLRDALLHAINVNRKESKEKFGVDEGEIVYLVFDNVEAVRSWDKSASILPLLFRLHDILRMPQVGLIYISSATPDAYYSSSGSMEPMHVCFPEYNVDEAFNILMLNQANPKLYAIFLSVVLKPFYRATRRIDELSVILKPLFHKYCEPLNDCNVVPDEGMKRRLFNNIQSHLAAALNEVVEIPSYVSPGTSKEESSNRKVNVRRLTGKNASNDLDFHMSVSLKYLLISAFLASRNPATLDAALFDTTGVSDHRNRKRKSSQSFMDRNNTIAEDMLMKGPGSFPLERLLAIFQCITDVMEGGFDEDQLEDRMASEAGKIGLMSDVLLQLSTLCNANFIIRSASCPLEGSTRFRSMIDEDMALKVARSINFPLSKYMYRR